MRLEMQYIFFGFLAKTENRQPKGQKTRKNRKPKFRAALDPTKKRSYKCWAPTGLSVSGFTAEIRGFLKQIPGFESDLCH